MKKYLALILGVLFVLSFAASAFAIHAEIPSETQAVVSTGTTQITLGGEIRTRGWWKDNIGSEAVIFDLDGDKKTDATITNHVPAKTPNGAYYDERVRLSVDATVAPGVIGRVMLETGSGATDIYTWGTNSFNSKPSALSINEAWIVYMGSGLLGFTSGVKVGHMPLALGEKQFFDHTKFGDDAVVFFMDPIKPLHLAALAIKFTEGAPLDNSDDTDGYVALATFKMDDNNTLGANFTYLNRPDGNPLFPAGSTVTQVTSDFKLMDLSVHANGSVAGLGYKAEADIQFGSQKNLAISDKQKFKGWAAMAGLNYMLNPVNLRASAAYGSGQKNSNDINEFITFMGADKHYTFVYDYQVATAGAISGLLNGTGQYTGIANTTYFNLGVDFNATKDVKLTADGYILRANKTDAFGSGVSKNIGWEVDASMTYALAKNLSYEMDGGYLHAGNFYADAFGEKKNVTVLMHKLTLSF